jgi:hypothetical protein
MIAIKRGGRSGSIYAMSEPRLGEFPMSDHRLENIAFKVIMWRM